MNPLNRNQWRLEDLEKEKERLSSFSSFSTTKIGINLLKLLKESSASAHKNIIDDLSNKVDIKIVDLRYWLGMADAFNRIHDIIIGADEKLAKIDEEILKLKRITTGDSDEQ